MVSQKITIKNATGIHLRPASVLTKIATGLTSKITIVKGDKLIDPKSVLILMGAGIKCGDEVEVKCEGPDEVSDLAVLIEAIESGLGE